MSRNGLLSQSLAAQVPSALYRFTARFGMGLGGSGTLQSRNKPLCLAKVENNKQRKRGNLARDAICGDENHDTLSKTLGAPFRPVSASTFR